MDQVFETKEYIGWFDTLGIKLKAQVHARITRVKTDGHFGMVRKLDNDLAEFKWKNGMRVYFNWAREQEDRIILLLLGGDKNSQKRDIKKAKLIIKRLDEQD